MEFAPLMLGLSTISPAFLKFVTYSVYCSALMSLLKQLLFSVTVAICVILVGALWSGLDGARSYLNSRLQVDAGNAASSLALSLSQPANQEPVTQELLIT